jgi:hypothetical protein
MIDEQKAPVLDKSQQRLLPTFIVWARCLRYRRPALRRLAACASKTGRPVGFVLEPLYRVCQCAAAGIPLDQEARPALSQLGSGRI